MVYTCMGVSFGLKKWNSDTWYNMDEPEDVMLSEISQIQRINAEWFSLHEVPWIVKFVETESRIEVTRGWGSRGREGGYCLMDTEFQFEITRAFWRWMVVMAAQQCAISLNCTLKNSQNGKVDVTTMKR
jgi:hypothetical protein